MAVFQKEAGTAHGRGFSEQDANGYLAKVVAWMTRPAANGSSLTFTADAGTDVLTHAGHGYVNLDVVRVSNSGGALPGGLAADTNCWVIYIDADTFSLASTYANAKIGTAIDILTAGSGTNSVLKYGGGPAWYIREDKSAPATKTFTADYTTDIITVAAGHDYGHGDNVWVSNSGGALPTGLVAGTNYYVIRIDGTTFKLASSFLNAIEGTAVNITSNGSGTNSIIMVEKYIVFCDTASPAVNDVATGPSGGPPKFIKIGFFNAEAGYIRIHFLCWWDTTDKTGRGYWAGYRITTSDDADFSSDIRGGAETLIACSRIGTAWSGAGMTEYTGDAELLEGTDKYGILQSGVTAGSSVVLQLDTGEAANFTQDNYYFIFDFDGHSWVNCCKVTNVNLGSDQITVDSINQNFPAGAVIGAYVHRWVAFGTNIGGASYANLNYNAYSKLPYTNAVNNTYVFHDQKNTITGGCYIGACSAFLERVAPNRKGNWGTEDLYVVEQRWENETASTQSGTTGAREGYGVLKNIFATNVGTMSPGLDGRVDGGKNYIYQFLTSFIFQGGYYLWAAIFLDTTATS